MVIMVFYGIFRRWRIMEKGHHYEDFEREEMQNLFQKVDSLKRQAADAEERAAKAEAELAQLKKRLKSMEVGSK